MKPTNPPAGRAKNIAPAGQSSSAYITTTGAMCVDPSSRVRVVNLTPHPVGICHSGGVINIPPSGQLARVVISYFDHDSYLIDGVSIPIRAIDPPTSIVGLPPPEPHLIYIVSWQCLQIAATMGRTDVCAPDTHGATRDADGHIVGVPGLISIRPPS